MATPCHSTVNSILGDLAVGPGKTVKDETYVVADELTKNRKFTFGTNFGEGKALTMSVTTPESAQDRKVAVCYYIAGNAFINGCEYEYEVDECASGREPCVINITEDALVSDLEGEYRWSAVRYGNANIDGCDFGAAYAIIKPNGNVVAKFYIK